MGLRKIKHKARQNARYLRNQIGLTRQVEPLTPWQSKHASKSQRITASAADECLTFVIVEQAEQVELEVIGWKPLSPQPDEPDYIKGMIPLRGAEIPVLDLEILTGAGRTEMTQETCIVLLENPEPYKHYFGIVVEGLSNVINIAHGYRKEGDAVQHFSENVPSFQ